MFVIKDQSNFKVMTTKPVPNNKYPQHYFVVYSDQKFHHFYDLKGINPVEILSKINSNKISNKNTCYRTIHGGLFALNN